MSKQVDKIFFWLIMVAIVSAIAFLSYVTFLSGTSHQSSNDMTNPPNNVTKEAEELYICLEGARIRSLPQKDGKIIYSPQIGEKLVVMGEKEEWLQVGKVLKQPSAKAGWIEKKYVCDQPPEHALTKSQPKKDSTPPDKSASKKKEDAPKSSQKTAPPPTPNPYLEGIPEGYPGEIDSYGGIENLMEGLFNRINSRAQMQYAQVLFDDYHLLDGGMRLEVRATGLWSLLPQGYKIQALQVLANQYALIACNVAKIVNCTPDLMPAISITNSSGREVAYQNSTGSQILE